MRKLYQRLVNAIIKWLLRHCPEALPEHLILMDQAREDTRKAIVDLSCQATLYLLRKLWKECPSGHLLVIVRQVGSNSPPIDIQKEIQDAIDNPPRNEMDTVDSTSMLGYATARFNTEPLRSGVVTAVFNPHRYNELSIVPDLENTIQKWIENDSLDPRNIIVGWKYVLIPTGEASAVEAE